MQSTKILYISHFLENTGWSDAAKNYVHSIYSSGLDIVCRNIKLNSNNGETSDLVKFLLEKDGSGYTHVINHTLPHHWCYTSTAKNIGLYIYDTTLCHYEWAKNLNLMDEIWSPTNYVLSSIPNYINKPCKVVPHATDITKFSRKYQKPTIPEVDGSYKFYFIGEANRRKNIPDIIKAFHTEFKRNEPVSLIIKSSIPGLPPEESAKAIANDFNRIKADTKLYPSIDKYLPEVIITERLSEEQLNGLHQYCDCFVTTSHGEAWGQPLFDAYGFGNSTIRYTGEYSEMYPYIKNNESASKIKVDYEPCISYDASFPFIGTAREEWLSSNITELKNSMRFYFDRWQKGFNKEKLYANNIEHINKFSYENIGKLIKGLI